MRVLYLTQYFPPEIGATQARAYEMARGMIEAGHRVTVVTEVPNHPEGIIPSEYRGRFWERTVLDGIDVIRVWVAASQTKSFGRRLAFYLSYMTAATCAGLFLARGPFDLVLATSPPLFVGAAGIALGASRRLPMVFEVRDLWPESAVELGELDNRLAIEIAARLERFCYQRARRVVVVTRGIERRLAERGVPDKKLVFVPNGANVEIYAPRPADPSLRARLGLEPGQFVVVYAGLHGLAHDLESILAAARLLVHQPDVVFLFIGEGPRKADMVEKARSMGLESVVFHEPVAERELPCYLALGNLGLHASRRLQISRSALPVKMFSYMACGLPVLLADEGEAADLVRAAGAGWVVPPEDPDSLARAVLDIRAAPEAAESCGRAGRDLVCARYSRRELAGRLVATLEDVAAEQA